MRLACLDGPAAVPAGASILPLSIAAVQSPGPHMPGSKSDARRRERIAGDRRAGSAQGGFSPPHGPRPVCRRCAAARSGACRPGALTACACQHPRHRHGYSPCRAGSASGVDRHRLPRRRVGAVAACCRADGAARHRRAAAGPADDHDPTRCAAGGHGALCRGAGRARRGRHDRPGKRRCRVGRGGL